MNATIRTGISRKFLVLLLLLGLSSAGNSQHGILSNGELIPSSKGLSIFSTPEGGHHLPDFNHNAESATTENHTVTVETRPGIADNKIYLKYSLAGSWDTAELRIHSRSGIQIQKYQLSSPIGEHKMANTASTERMYRYYLLVDGKEAKSGVIFW